MADELAGLLLYEKIQTGAPLTPREWLLTTLGGWRSSLREFRWRARITPKLRQDCVEYALRNNPESCSGLTWEAQRIAEYIAKGKC